MVIPPLFSLLVNLTGVWLYTPFIALVYILLLAAVVLFARHLKKRGRFTHS